MPKYPGHELKQGDVDPAVSPLKARLNRYRDVNPVDDDEQPSCASRISCSPASVESVSGSSSRRTGCMSTVSWARRRGRRCSPSPRHCG
jgi:hypothetical protein